MSQKKEADLVVFEVLESNNPSKRMFHGYSDPKTYEHKVLVKSRKMNQGQMIDVWERFEIKPYQARFSVPRYREDIYGNNYAEWLKESVFCKGSPANEASNITPWFKVQDKKGEAKKSVQLAKLKYEAQTRLFQLKNSELKDMASFLGYFGDDDDIMMDTVSKYATEKPKEFLEAAGEERTKIEGLVRTCKNLGILKQTSGKWTIHEGEQSEIFGAGIKVDNIVSMLSEDKQKLKLLRDTYSRFTNK